MQTPVSADKQKPDKRQARAKYLGLFVILASLIDAVSTIIITAGQHASEDNPFMGYLLDLHPAVFFLVKMGVTVGGIWWLIRKCDNRIAYGGLYLCATAYACLMAYQAFFLIDNFL